MAKTPLFHKGHYNILANQIMISWPHSGDHNKDLIGRNAIVAFSLRLCKRLEEDNPNFDPLKFLDQCSPDPDTMPLSELWEVYNR